MKPITLRPARISDLEDIREWHAAQNVRDSTGYPLPRIFNADGTLSVRVPVALIGEKDGEAQQALFVERCGELQFAGCDPRATAFARRDIDALATVLRWQGYGSLYCRVPVSLAKSVGKPLKAAGFKRINEQFVTFFKDLEAS